MTICLQGARGRPFCIYMTKNSAAWTKKEVNALNAQLDAFWLGNRPMHGIFIDVDKEREARKFVREFLQERRSDAILQGLRSSEQTASLAYSKDCECVGNNIVRFGANTDSEIVVRFVASAKERDTKRRFWESLRKRVLKEPLPEQVVQYDPVPKG